MCPAGRSIGVPRAASKNSRVRGPSGSTVATAAESGERARSRGLPQPAGRRARSLPLGRSYRPVPFPFQLTARVSPSGPSRMADTAASSGPTTRASTFPVAVSYTPTRPASVRTATRRPSGLNATGWLGSTPSQSPSTAHSSFPSVSRVATYWVRLWLIATHPSSGPATSATLRFGPLERPDLPVAGEVPAQDPLAVDRDAVPAVRGERLKRERLVGGRTEGRTTDRRARSRAAHGTDRPGMRPAYSRLPSGPKASCSGGAASGSRHSSRRTPVARSQTRTMGGSALEAATSLPSGE